MSTRTFTTIVIVFLFVLILSTLFWVGGTAAQVDINPFDKGDGTPAPDTQVEYHRIENTSYSLYLVDKGDGTPAPDTQAEYHRIENVSYTLDGPINTELLQPESLSADGWVTIMSEDFEGTFPGSWSVVDNNGSTGGEYYWNKRNCRPYQGSNSGWAVGGGADGSGLTCGSNFPNDADTWMVYGPFSLEDATDAELRYWMWMNTDQETDALRYLASIDGSNFYGGGFYGSGDWAEQVFDLKDVPTLGNLMGEPEVWIAFKFGSDGSNSLPEGAYLDNILLQKNVSTTTPTPTPTEPPGGWVTIMSEDFEGTFPGSWSVVDNNGSTGGEYYWNKRNCRPYQGSNSGWAVGGGADGSGLTCGSNFPNDADTWMVYGPFSLEDATDAELRYWMWMNTDQETDALRYLASIDGSSFYGGGFYGSGDWVEQVFDLKDVPTLGNLMGEPEVWIAFKFGSDGSNSLPEGAYLDNILLQKNVSTTTPTPTPTPTATPTEPPGDWSNIMTEDFEGNFPYNWTVFDDNGPNYGEYQWGKRNCRPYQGSYSGWGVGGGIDGSALACGSVFPTNADSWMMYGPFSLENAVDGELLFKLWLNTNVDGEDSIFYGASLDGTNYSGTFSRGYSAGWLDKDFDLTDVYNLGNLMGQSEVWIAFVFESDGVAGDDLEEGAYVDDIVLRVKKTGVVPPDFQIFLPLSLNNSTSYFEGPWEQEPNDNFARANGNLRSGKTYYGHHNDVADYFKVYLSQSGQITVDLDSQLTVKDNLGNYVVQLQLKDENGVRLDYKVGPDVQISRSVSPGVYYIYVHTRVDYVDATKQYSLVVTYPQ